MIVQSLHNIIPACMSVFAHNTHTHNMYMCVWMDVYLVNTQVCCQTHEHKAIALFFSPQLSLLQNRIHQSAGYLVALGGFRGRWKQWMSSHQKNMLIILMVHCGPIEPSHPAPGRAVGASSACIPMMWMALRNAATRWQHPRSCSVCSGRSSRGLWSDTAAYREDQCVTWGWTRSNGNFRGWNSGQTQGIRNGSGWSNDAISHVLFGGLPHYSTSCGS